MHVPPPKDLVIPSGLKGKYRSPCFSFSTTTSTTTTTTMATTIAQGAATAEFHTSTLYRESISLFCLNFILSAAQEKYTTDLYHLPPHPRPLDIVHENGEKCPISRFSFRAMKRNFASFFIARTISSRFHYYKLQHLGGEISTAKRNESLGIKTRGVLQRKG